MIIQSTDRSPEPGWSVNCNWTLKRKEQSDTFALSRAIVMGNLVSINDGLSTPNIERVF